jgi:transcription elongation factor GreA
MNTNGSMKVHLTQEGYDEIQQELDVMKAKHPDAVDRVTKAREHGDLSENSEYHAAREDLSFIMGRIEELEELLARAEIVKPSNKNSSVDFGSKVTVSANSNEVTYAIVGEYEADPTKKKISHDSPLGQSLMGKKIGEQVEFEAPVGKVIYTIKKIH